MKLAALSLIALLMLHSAALGDEALQNSIRGKIEEVIRQRHPTDTEQWWRTLGPEAPGVIIGMYKENTETHQRIRLLQGLRAFPEDTTAVAFLTDEAAGTKKSVIRNAAVQALGASQGERALEELGDYLKHPDPQTRFAAAKAIDRIGTEKSRGVLDAYLGGEKVSWIGARIKAESEVQATPALPPPGLEESGIGDWAGQWKGHWIEPKGPTDLVTTPIEFKITQSEDKLEGQISLGARKLRIQASPVNTKGRWAGRLSRVGKPGERITSVGFEAILERQAGKWVILMRVPDLATNAVLTRR